MIIHKVYLELASQMKMKRSEMKISQQELADRVGLSKAAISRMETGQCKILAHNFLTIAMELHIPFKTFTKKSLYD